MFANGVILAEGYSEYISVSIILKKLDCALEDYNIEIINVLGEDNLKKYIEIMESLNINFKIICDKKAKDKLDEQYKNRCFDCDKDDWVIFLVEELENCKVSDENNLKTFSDLLKEYNINVNDIKAGNVDDGYKILVSYLVSRLIFEKSENGEYKVGEGIKKLKQFIDNFIKECTNI